jgi:hypothetical protein
LQIQAYSADWPAGDEQKSAGPGATTCWHAPAEQASAVHATPSLHETGVAVHPVAGSHASAVQASPSSQLSASPGVHAPARHTPKPVHASPSSHVAPAGSFACWHPLAGSHESAVHWLPSSH